MRNRDNKEQGQGIWTGGRNTKWTRNINRNRHKTWTGTDKEHGHIDEELIQEQEGTQWNMMLFHPIFL